MANSTPSSLICFKNGYSYVNIPVSLPSDQAFTKENESIRECQVGPLPDFAVHGTVSLAPHNPECVKIFSLCQAAKKITKPPPLKIPNEENDFSYEKLLMENIGTAVRITCLIQSASDNGAHFAPIERTFDGIVKAIHKDSKERVKVILRSLERNTGEILIQCSSIVFLETIQITDHSTQGKRV